MLPSGGVSTRIVFRQGDGLWEIRSLESYFGCNRRDPISKSIGMARLRILGSAWAELFGLGFGFKSRVVLRRPVMGKQAAEDEDEDEDL